MSRKVGLLEALQFPQYVGHAGTGQVYVVDARRATLFDIETTQEVVQVIDTLGARNQGEIRRLIAVPARGICRFHRRADRLEGLFRIEHQVVDELLFRQFEMLADRRESDVLRRMATGTVVHVIARAALQGSNVAAVDLGGLHCGAAAGREGRCRRQAAPDDD